MSKIPFSKKSIEQITPPSKGYITFYDSNMPGLGLRIMAGGSKTFFVYRKINGKPERITIGKFPSVTVEMAHKQTKTINAQITEGINPNQAKKHAREELTFAQVFDKYMVLHAKKYKATWQEDQRQYQCYLQSFKSRRLSEISRQDIEKLHTQIGTESGIYAANRVLALLKTIFNKAVGWEYCPTNPVIGIRKFKEKSRERFLQPEELPKFFQTVMEELNTDLRDYVLLSLITGARRSNVLSMEWEHIDFNRKTWTIPKTKNGDSHTIPLIGEAITILTQRQQHAINQFVFGSTRSECGHLVDMKEGWSRLLKRAGIKNLRLHDLRRTLGSWQAATGANLSVIGKTLAHKSVTATAVYARLNLDPVRDSMENAVSAMLKFHPNSGHNSTKSKGNSS